MSMFTQVRGGEILEEFNHETRNKLLSLANSGEIRGGVKADRHSYKILNWFLFKRKLRLKLQFQRDLSR